MNLHEWRSALAARGTMREEDLDELESHLLDHADALTEEGLDRAAAFEHAIARLGDVNAIADEFAKVNPLLAWRMALFWICAGVMMVLGLRPLQVLATHAFIDGSIALGLPGEVRTGIVWAVAFVSPLLFFAGAFALVQRRTRGLSLFSSPIARVLAIVGATVTMLAEHLGSSWGLFFVLEYRALDPALLDDAWTSVLKAMHVLGIVAPLALAGFALHQRARGRSPSAFWLAVGFFVGAIRCELHELVRFLTLAGAAASHLDAARTGALVWVVTLSSPIVLAAGTYTFLRHHAPLPSGVARSRGVVVSLVLGAVLAIAAVFLTRPVSHHATSVIDHEAFLAGFHAWNFSSIVMAAVLPILVGALTFRLRARAELT